MNVQRCRKAIAAGWGAGCLAFVPLAAGATRWAIAADVGAAVGVGIFTAVVTYFAPKNVE